MVANELNCYFHLTLTPVLCLLHKMLLMPLDQFIMFSQYLDCGLNSAQDHDNDSKDNDENCCNFATGKPRSFRELQVAGCGENEG